MVAKSVGSSVQRHRVARRLRHVARSVIADLEPADRVVIRALPEQQVRHLGPARTAAADRAASHGAAHERRDDDGVPPGHAAAARGVIFLIQLYRNTVSPLRLPTCRFTPTCSQYAVEALTEYGMIRGGWLAMVRLAKCGPWHRGGWDPIPERHGRSRREQRCASTTSGVPQRSEGRASRVFDWFSLDIIYYPVSAIMWVWYKAFAFVLGPVQLLRLGAVGDVPGVHPARDPVQAVRPADPHHAADAGAAAADQGAAEEVRQGPPADGAGDAEAAEANTGSTRSSAACRCWRRSRCSWACITC